MDDYQKMRILVTVVAIISIIGGGIMLYMGTTTDGGKNAEALFVALGVMLVFNGFNLFRQRDQYK